MPGRCTGTSRRVRASCARRGFYIRPRTRSRTDERRLSACPDVDDVARLKLELVRLVPRQLGVQALTVVAHELDARLEAETHDPLHLCLLRRAVRLVAELDVVRAHPRVAEAVDGTDEAHHERVGRLVVELARRRRLLDTALVHHDD